MTVHSVLPTAPADAVDAVLAAAGIAHVPHAEDDPVRAAELAAGDPAALALIGPIHSAAVAEAVEATAPAGLPLLAPLATWAGVTRDDEPGCDDPARHDGTVLRLVARDTVVCERLARELRAARRLAIVIAGDHDYGRQLDGQLRLGGLPRTEDASAADVVVLAGLEGRGEVERAAELAPLPVIAFDGIQGADLGEEREVLVALPIPPPEHRAGPPFAGVEQARRAAVLVSSAHAAGTRDRGGDAQRAARPRALRRARRPAGPARLAVARRPGLAARARAGDLAARRQKGPPPRGWWRLWLAWAHNPHPPAQRLEGWGRFVANSRQKGCPPRGWSSIVHRARGDGEPRAASTTLSSMPSFR